MPRGRTFTGDPVLDEVNEFVRKVFAGRRATRQVHRGSHLRAEVKISSLEAVSGRKCTIEFSRLECKVFCRGDCQGAELVKVRREIEFQIPPGTKSGQRLRFGYQGNHSSVRGRPGDLFCDIVVA
jgi:DnaJ-class molecular chaperone